MSSKKSMKSALKRDLKRSLRSVKKLDLATVEAKGITLKRIRALQAGKASFSATARTSKVIVVTRGSKRFARNGKAKVRLKFTKSGKQLIGTASRVTLRVKGSFLPRTGGKVTAVARVTLKRKTGATPSPGGSSPEAPLPFNPSTVPSPIPGNVELLHSQAFDQAGPWPLLSSQCGHAVQWERQLGNGYAHFEVRPEDLEVAGEERCEVSLGGYGSPQIREPGEYWYRTVQRTGAGFPAASGWAYIQQWHEDRLEGSTSGETDAAQFVNTNSSMRLDGEFLPFSQSSVFAIGDWHEYTVHGVWTDQATGYLEWWIDRKFVGRTTGVTSSSGGRHYWKGGITRAGALDTLQSADISSVEVYRAP